VDPSDERARPLPVRRVTRSAAAAAALSILLAACASDRGQDDVVDNPTKTAEPTTAPTAATGSPGPSPAGSTTETKYPAFVPETYTFQLVINCFCMGADVPIRVTVAHAVAVDATYAADGAGVKAGEPAAEAFWLTINDVIDAASDTSVARVDVDWPDGQDYPTTVHVDRAVDATDDDIVYTIGDVHVS
jgi:hypothetical protein